MTTLALSPAGWYAIYFGSLVLSLIVGLVLGFRWRPHYDAAVDQWDKSQADQSPGTN